MDIQLSTTTRVKRHSFTLIELLIVIGLLGALTALILPSLSASREDALLDVCDYNQAGTARTLLQYANLYGVLPTGMHTGLTNNESNAELMGMPAAPAANYATAGSIVALTANQITSLVNGGLTGLAYGDGYNVVPTEFTAGQDGDPDETLYVARVTADWEDDGEEEFTFRGGRSLEALGVEGAEADGILIALWITPTMDWESGFESGSDWSRGNVKLAIDLEGKCPIPVDDEFRYYIAYVKAFNNGSAAKLVGTSCPEHGIMNP